jgi:hypothetical protein
VIIRAEGVVWRVSYAIDSRLPTCFKSFVDILHFVSKIDAAL